MNAFCQLPFEIIEICPEDQLQHFQNFARQHQDLTESRQTRNTNGCHCLSRPDVN